MNYNYPTYILYVNITRRREDVICTHININVTRMHPTYTRDFAPKRHNREFVNYQYMHFCELLTDKTQI